MSLIIGSGEGSSFTPEPTSPLSNETDEKFDMGFEVRSRSGNLETSSDLSSHQVTEKTPTSVDKKSASLFQAIIGGRVWVAEEGTLLDLAAMLEEKDVELIEITQKKVDESQKWMKSSPKYVKAFLNRAKSVNPEQLFSTQQLFDNIRSPRYNDYAGHIELTDNEDENIKQLKSFVVNDLSEKVLTFWQGNTVPWRLQSKGNFEPREQTLQERYYGKTPQEAGRSFIEEVIIPTLRDPSKFGLTVREGDKKNLVDNVIERLRKIASGAESSPVFTALCSNLTKREA